MAIATDKTIRPVTHFPDSSYLPGKIIVYGQDLTSNSGRVPIGKLSAGKNATELKARMQKLIPIFASSDETGMVARLFGEFFTKLSSPRYFDDPSLNYMASIHQNINYWCDAALSAPNSKYKAVGKIRIHQALEAADWDINNISAPTDLGVPAFNRGNKYTKTGDFSNGLGLMINGVQHAYALANYYSYDNSLKRYKIGIRFVFCDVFGLDDKDLVDFGVSACTPICDSTTGIHAWWQLQHQYGYAPLVTRIVIDKNYEVNLN